MAHSLRPILELEILKQLYFSYVHSVLCVNYDIMFSGNSPHSRFIFMKHIIRIIMNKQTPWPLVCERTIPTERPPLVDEI
jgi:hypothetical protein